MFSAFVAVGFGRAVIVIGSRARDNNDAIIAIGVEFVAIEKVAGVESCDSLG